MSLKGILGLVLLLVGIFAFVYGLNASNSLVEQLNNTFLGRFSETTTWYIIGGLASAVVGLLLILSGFVRKRR
ncbi:MAG: DUF3185 family protein [Spirochaetales bacterium]|jgi:uncharacterized membrane protein